MKTFKRSYLIHSETYLIHRECCILNEWPYMYIDYIWDYSCAVEVYIGSDINGQPDRPDKISNKPTRYPNGENRTTRTRPDSEPDTK